MVERVIISKSLRGDKVVYVRHGVCHDLSLLIARLFDLILIADACCIIREAQQVQATG